MPALRDMERHAVTRRHALRGAGVGVILLALTACSSPTPTPTAVTQSVVAAPAQSASAPVPQDAVLAAVRLNEPGPEAQLLSQRVGLWDVTETLWDHPGAPPVTTSGLVAERVMLGPALQEFIRPPSDTTHADVKRTDLLTFNRLVGQWDYVSLDTRVPVGLMPASSNVAGDGTPIEVTFAPFAMPGPGVEATGQLLRMQETIDYHDADHDVKDQYFTPADGTGRTWLAHRYAYTRRA